MTSHTDQDWQCDKTLQECMASMLDKEIMCDVTFLMGEEGHEVNAHKYVLVSRSPVFQAMLDGAMAERGKIKITDIDKDTFQVFIRYLYTDDAPLTEENVLEVLYASKKYCVDRLTKKCKEFLQFNISAYNACLLMDVVDELVDKDVHRYCLRTIKDNLEVCLASPWFKSVGRKCVQAITRLKGVYIREEFLFEQVMKWCDAECERQKIEVSWSNKREVLGDILYNIRFPLMTVSYFTKEVEKILPPEETSALLKPDEVGNPALLKHIRRCQYHRVVRFPTNYDRSWPANHDAILFRTYGDLCLYGILVYGCYDTPCRYSVHVKIKEGQRNILTEFSTSIESIPEVSMHDIQFDPIRLMGEVYTVEISMKGSPTKAGSNGRKTVPFGPISQVHFFYANNSPYGTNQELGQIPGLLLRERDTYRQRHPSLYYNL
ncbi:hypothetical protein FSP39_006909 [Pinctada imbricata]|uniref:BTB domain-containing protein n=1 Tax=Pinctada imbricata TaxID=66713 RepID=A0AA89BSK8_PINIB|nr:hypothetical protein FSP39_006909 [Pinctada imbricata]